ncbi:LacI family DNA-binding transcriptional regulator [Microbacterium immunditiarum]|uniref:DNA-binding LacI/PurR family transcriptional regulator n=1 Tax=Microbacterium immunditiarum TaxID=337480 RepID=A0A7Y9GM29_9MICO|nr:LacI family DNA-binding transcriptional regulator [Microbacterium immunditiarum]NYE19018.1 DNA-binding LacI/PurR family transcriptional regulator [Microbacterium immunditiarum]
MSETTGRRQSVRISDVAAAAGVSKALVSYALNDRPGVKESTRAHIVSVARSMGWTPSLRGRALSSSRAYAIGLVFETLPETLAGDQYFTSLMAGLQSVLSTSQYSLVTEVVHEPGAEVAAYRRLASEGRVDGMVLVDLHRDGDPRFDILVEHELAFVSLGRPPAATDMPVMLYDESDAISDVIEHLASLGHKRIAQVVGPQAGVSARVRRELYQRELRERGLDDSWWVESDYTAIGGRAATERLLAHEDPPTAIIYSNDLMAVAGMGTAFQSGLRIPEDLSVVGWDDITVAQYLHPALSTVTQHPFEDGRLAAALLLEAVDGRRFSEPVWTQNPRFVPRESTGPVSFR